MNAREAYEKLILEGAEPNRIFVHSKGNVDDATGIMRRSGK